MRGTIVDITLELLHELFFLAHQLNRNNRTLKWHVWKPSIDPLARQYWNSPDNIGYFTFDDQLNITHMFGLPVVVYSRNARGELMYFDLMLEDTDVGDYLIWDQQKNAPHVY